MLSFIVCAFARYMCSFCVYVMSVYVMSVLFWSQERTLSGSVISFCMVQDKLDYLY